MNAKQLMNMVMRIVMRKTISKGIDAGVKQATRTTRRRPPAPSHMDMEDPDCQDGVNSPVPQAQNGPTKAQVREQRKARRAARQARQDAKNESGPTGS